MSPRRRYRAAVTAAATACLVVAIGGCAGLDDSSGDDQNAACRDAIVGSTLRTDVHKLLGPPTLTVREHEDGRRLLVDAWADGTVSLAFDGDDGELVEKDC